MGYTVGGGGWAGNRAGQQNATLSTQLQGHQAGFFGVHLPTDLTNYSGYSRAATRIPGRAEAAGLACASGRQAVLRCHERTAAQGSIE